MAARGSQMRVIFPKLPEFGSRGEKPWVRILPVRHQFCEDVLAEGLQSAVKFGGSRFFVC